MNNNNPMNQPLLDDHNLQNQNHGEQNVENTERLYLDIEGCVPFMMFIVIGPSLIATGIVDAYNNQFDYLDSLLISTGIFLSATGIHSLCQSGTRISKLMRKVMVGSFFGMAASVTGMITDEKINFSLFKK